MVVLHIKRGNQSLFLYEATVNVEVLTLVPGIIHIHNGQLKVERICAEIEYLAKHGVCLPSAMQGLTHDQVIDLKLCDDWSATHLTTDNYIDNPDPFGKRNGKAPLPNFVDVLTKTAAEAKAKICKKLVDANISLNHDDIQDAVDMLKGAVIIAYPMGLPSYDVIQQELDNKEDLLSGTQAGQEVLDIESTDLWWAGKQLKPDKKLSEYVGKNEKSKIIVKLQKKGHGPPSQEPMFTEEQQKELLLAEYKRQEELKRLEEADDDHSYLNSSWADNRKLQKSFQGLADIKFNFK